MSQTNNRIRPNQVGRELGVANLALNQQVVVIAPNREKLLAMSVIRVGVSTATICAGELKIDLAKDGDLDDRDMVDDQRRAVRVFELLPLP